MSAYQRLDMRQGQSLIMTPQLQQAIKLLQLSNLELAEFIAEEVERNPLLEHKEPNESIDPDHEPPDKAARREELALDGDTGLGAARDAVDASDSDMYEAGTGSDEAMPACAQTGPSASTEWSSLSNNRGGEGFDFESHLSSQKTLSAHLHEQLALSGLSLADNLIAARLIDETDEHGYCKVDVQDVANALGAEVRDVEAVLSVCQGFEPTGIMAPDLETCLALQLKELNRYDPAMEAMLQNLHLVARHDIMGLSELCGVSHSDIMDMLVELRTLSPRPASGFAQDAAITVIPDVFVRELPNGMHAVEVNNDTLPKVLINQAYYAEVNALPMRQSEKEFISECAANATWLVKSLDQRARTILKVSSEIVRQQDAFFAHGVAHLRPLNLKQVADAIDMHESTVSRVTTNKYMATPRGLFELKYFFSAAIPSTGGGDAHSAEAVRYRIKQLIDEEGAKILSDDKIVDILTEFGIDIARRTVAKYRESLGIPSSVQRRRKFKASA